MSLGSCPTSPERTGQCLSSGLGGGWLGGGGRCCNVRALGLGHNLGGGWRYQRGMLSVIVHWDVELLKNACIQHHFGTGTFCERCKLQLLFHSPASPLPSLPSPLPPPPPVQLHVRKLPFSMPLEGPLRTNTFTVSPVIVSKLPKICTHEVAPSPARYVSRYVCHRDALPVLLLLRTPPL